MILRKMAAGNETGQALHKNGLRLSTKQGAVQNDISTENSVTNLSIATEKISGINCPDGYLQTQDALNVLYFGAGSKGKKETDPVYFTSHQPVPADTVKEKQLVLTPAKTIKKLGKAVPKLESPAEIYDFDKAQHYWHGPNPNPSNDPQIEHDMDQNVDNWCSQHPSAHACDPSNPYSPLHNDNPKPDTPNGTHGSPDNGGGDKPCDTLNHDGTTNC
jgi:hypothetical protein